MGLSILSEFMPEIAAGIGAIALITVAFLWVPKIAKGAGLLS